MKIKWISEEEKEIVGFGVFKKNDKLDVPTELAEQLISQGLARDSYITQEEKKQRKDRR